MYRLYQISNTVQYNQNKLSVILNGWRSGRFLESKRFLSDHAQISLKNKGISCRYDSTFRLRGLLIANKEPKAVGTPFGGHTSDYSRLLIPYSTLQLNRNLCRFFSSKLDKIPVQKHSFKKVIKLLWPTDLSSKKRIFISMIFLISAKLSLISVPLFLSQMISSLLNQPHGTIAIFPKLELLGMSSPEILLPYAYLLGYSLSRISTSLFNELRNSVFSTVTEHSARINASNMFMNIHNLDIDFLIQSKSGEVSAVFSRGIKAISQILRITVFQVVPVILEFSLVTGLLCYKVGPSIAAISAVTVCLYLLFTTVVTKRRMVIRRDMADADRRASGLFLDSITNAEAVKYYNAQINELKRYTSHQVEYEKNSVDVQKSLAFLNFGQQLIFNSGLFVSLLFTLANVINGTNQINDFIVVNTLLFQIGVPLNMIGTMYREVKLSFVDLQKFLDLVGIRPKVQEMPGAKDLVIDKAKIEFKDVTYWYPSLECEPHTILDGFSLAVTPGKTVAIVGDSGSGKSTISKLLFRFYDPCSGSITIDDQDIRTVTIKSLRDALGIVPQDVVLFNESILFNISYGKPDAPIEEVIKAAKLAGIHDTIVGFPDGYETVVGERGMKLSGGEKQRIGIARCFLKDPQILIFDEATSSLDFKAEEQIIKTFKEMGTTKTTIMIAHRLSSILIADEIVVFRNGKVVEMGSPYELFRNKRGYFRQVVNSLNLRSKTEEALG